MNSNQSIILLVILLLTSSRQLWAIPSDREFATMPLEEARQTIKQLPVTGESMQELANAVLRSKRMDLISLCFEGGGTIGSIVDETKALPDSAYKDQIVVMMLKSAESPYWPPGNEVLTYGYTWSPRMVEPFSSVIKKLRPGISVTDALIADRSARQKLALELEKAIVPEPVQPNPGGADSPPKSTVTPMPNPPRPPTTNAAPLAASKDAERPRLADRLWPWIVGIATLLALVAFLLKHRRSP